MKTKTRYKIYGTQQEQFKREVYSNTSLPQETRKISNKQPKLWLKELEKVEQIKPNTDRRESMKTRAEINETETKKIQYEKKKINDSTNWNDLLYITGNSVQYPVIT